MGSEGIAGFGSAQTPQAEPIGSRHSKGFMPGPGPVVKISAVSRPIIAQMKVPFEADRTLTDLQKSAVHFNTIPHTHLEGAIYSASINNMSSFLRGYGNMPVDGEGGGDRVALKVASQFEKMNQKTKTIEAIEIGSSNISLKDFSSELMHEVLSLKPGGKTLIPGGTMKHAMLYEIEKQINGGYKFSVVNTGDSIEHHHKAIIGGKEKYSPAYTITNIRGDKLNEQFFKKLMGYQIKNTAVDRIYGLVDGLGGRKMAPAEYEQHPEMFINPQKLGTCTHKALSAYLKMQYYHAPEGKHLTSKERMKPFKRMKLMSKVSTLNNLAGSMGVLKTKGVVGGNSAYRNHEKFVQLATASFENSFDRKRESYSKFMSQSEIDQISSLLARVKDSCSYEGTKICYNFSPSIGYGSDVVYNEARVHYFPGNPSVVAVVNASTGEIHSHGGEKVIYSVGLVFSSVVSSSPKYSDKKQRPVESFSKALKNTDIHLQNSANKQIKTGLVSSGNGEKEEAMLEAGKAKAKKAKDQRAFDHRQEMDLRLKERLQRDGPKS
ncbi:MAG: hypothetical protein ACI9S8_001440 [Chlamydiales bacterium]|jgi:hypothetical protein